MVKDQAKAGPEASMTERLAMGVSEFESLYIIVCGPLQTYIMTGNAVFLTSFPQTRFVLFKHQQTAEAHQHCVRVHVDNFFGYSIGWLKLVADVVPESLCFCCNTKFLSLVLRG